MARKVKPWRGKTHDSAIPGDVRLRLWSKCKGHCEACTRKILAGEKKAVDHITPLADGGEHDERNMQILCEGCHKLKTGKESTERAKVRNKAKSILGMKPPSKKPLKSAPFPKYEKPAKTSSKITPRNTNIFGNKI